MLFGVVEALGFDILDLVHGVLLYFSPAKFFFKKIKNHKVETPQIVTPRQVDVVVGVEACKAHCASEVSSSSLLDRAFRVVIQVLFCESEVNDVYFLKVLAENKIGSFNITMDIISVVHLFDGIQHLYEQLYGHPEVVVELEYPPDPCEVESEEVHDN